MVVMLRRVLRFALCPLAGDGARLQAGPLPKRMRSRPASAPRLRSSKPSGPLRSASRLWRVLRRAGLFSRLRLLSEFGTLRAVGTLPGSGTQPARGASSVYRTFPVGPTFPVHPTLPTRPTLLALRALPAPGMLPILRTLPVLGILSVLALLPAPPAHAANLATATSPSLCDTAVTSAEYTARLPPRLLGAIAVVESGRLDSATGQIRPWPWTINAEGIGQFFPTKAQAIAAVMALQARGVRSIDVGCLQVNLMFHPDAFATLDQAFDPASNARYAARFLTTLNATAHDWPRAIGAYHSQTPALGADYRVLVMERWQQPSLARTEIAHAAYQDFASPQTTYNAFVNPDQVYGAFATRR